MKVLAIYKNLTFSRPGDVTEVMRRVAEVAAEPFHSGNLENFHIVEHPAGHMVLKKLIANDEQRTKDGKEGMSDVILILFKYGP